MWITAFALMIGWSLRYGKRCGAQIRAGFAGSATKAAWLRDHRAHSARLRARL